MENEKHNFEESRQNELLLKEKEFKQLQSTIVELRTKLETKNGRKKIPETSLRELLGFQICYSR